MTRRGEAGGWKLELNRTSTILCTRAMRRYLPATLRRFEYVTPTAASNPSQFRDIGAWLRSGEPEDAALRPLSLPYNWDVGAAAPRENRGAIRRDRTFDTMDPKNAPS